MSTSWKESHPISSVHHFRLNNATQQVKEQPTNRQSPKKLVGLVYYKEHTMICWVLFGFNCTRGLQILQHMSFLFNNFLGGLKKGFFTWIGLWFIYFFRWAPFSWEWVWVATKTFHHGFVKGAGHTRKLYCPWIYIDWWHGPLLGIFVMKTLHNFNAWSFLFEIVKQIDDLGKMVTFLEKSFKNVPGKSRWSCVKNMQISIPPTSKGTITAAQVGWIGVWVFLRYFFGKFNGWQWEKDEIHLTKNPWAFWVVFLIFQRGGAAVRI